MSLNIFLYNNVKPNLKIMKKLILIPKETKPDPDVITVNEEDIDMSFFDDLDGDLLKDDTGGLLDTRSDLEFKGKAIWLNSNYNYILGKDSNNSTILIPLKTKQHI